MCALINVCTLVSSTYVYINSPSHHCGSCNDTLSDHGYLIIIVSKYMPLTLMVCFIMFFDINLVDGPLAELIYSILSNFDCLTSVWKW